MRPWLIFFGAVFLVGTPSYLWTVAYMRANIPLFDPQALYPYTLRRFQNHAYLAEIIPRFRVGEPDTSQHPRRSTLLLYENGVVLGPAHTDHHEIIGVGLGRYSHWANGRPIIMFSTSDNSDPRTNGRTYRVVESDVR